MQWEVLGNAPVLPGAEVPPELPDLQGSSADSLVLEAQWLHCGSITACRERGGVENSLPFRWLLDPTEEEAARTLEASYKWIKQIS